MAREVLEGAEDDRVLDAVERAHLHASLPSHSQGDRELLTLRYGDDLTQAAIALKLGIPEGTVKVRLHRARAKLRRAYATA